MIHKEDNEMKFKKVAALVLASAMTLGLAACGNGNSSTPSQSSGGASSSGTTSSSATEISLWSFNIGGFTDAASWDSLIAAFNEEHPDITIEVNGQPLAVAQSYKARTTKESRYVEAFGSREPVKSVGNGHTFRRNLEGEADCRAALISLCDQVAARLRRSNLWAGGVQITIRDPGFRVITRQKQLEQSTHLARELFQAGWELLSRNWNFANPIRMLTVTAHSITDEPFAVQQSFFEDAPKPDPRREKLEKSLDSIRQKYGSAAVTPASLVKNQLGLPTPKIQDRPQEEDEGFARPKGPL